jgi:hypothetical protein
MGLIMIIVLFSRFFKVPVYLSELDLIGKISDSTSSLLSNTSFVILGIALLTGAIGILAALVKGMSEHRRDKDRKEKAAYAVAAAES